MEQELERRPVEGERLQTLRERLRRMRIQAAALLGVHADATVKLGNTYEIIKATEEEIKELESEEKEA